jgi:hypothetical protein
MIRPSRKYLNKGVTCNDDDGNFVLRKLDDVIAGSMHSRQLQSISSSGWLEIDPLNYISLHGFGHTEPDIFDPDPFFEKSHSLRSIELSRTIFK